MKYLILATLVGCAQLAQADVKAGEKKAQICVLCHKPNNPMAYVPTLEGQPREYLYNQIKAFKEKRRSDTAMQTNASSLSDKDMRDIAEYFASRKPVRVSFQADPQKVMKGESKAQELKCGTCHLPDFAGKKEVPRLAGLEPRYLQAQILEFKLAKRAHPPVEGMGAISEDDAGNLAQYFARLE